MFQRVIKISPHLSYIFFMVLQWRQRVYNLQFPHLDLLLAKMQTFGSCGLKGTEGAILTFIMMKPKYVNILLYLAREAELWVK